MEQIVDAWGFFQSIKLSVRGDFSTSTFNNNIKKTYCKNNFLQTKLKSKNYETFSKVRTNHSIMAFFLWIFGSYFYKIVWSHVNLLTNIVDRSLIYNRFYICSVKHFFCFCFSSPERFFLLMKLLIRPASQKCKGFCWYFKSIPVMLLCCVESYIIYKSV